MLFLNLSIYYAILVQQFIFREFLEKRNKYRDLKYTYKQWFYSVYFKAH